MSDSEKSFIEAFKKQVIAVAVMYAFILVGVGIGFYYTTNSSIAMAEKERAEMKLQIDKKINKDDYIREVTEMKELLRDMNHKIDRIK